MIILHWLRFLSSSFIFIQSHHIMLLSHHIMSLSQLILLCNDASNWLRSWLLCVPIGPLIYQQRSPALWYGLWSMVYWVKFWISLFRPVKYSHHIFVYSMMMLPIGWDLGSSVFLLVLSFTNMACIMMMPSNWLVQSTTYIISSSVMMPPNWLRSWTSCFPIGPV